MLPPEQERINDPEINEPGGVVYDILTIDREAVVEQTRSLDYDEGKVSMRMITVVLVDDSMHIFQCCSEHL